jgi:hypothetical protein
MAYIVLRDRWFNITVPIAHASTEEKSDDSKDSFYEELERVFDYFSKFKLKIVLEILTQIGERGYIEIDKWE